MRKFGLITVITVLLALTAGLAVAQEETEEGSFEASEIDTNLSFDFYQSEDDETSVLFYAVGEDADCELNEEGTITVGEDGTIEGGPEGCFAVDVQGPNGQVNHGTVVSGFVHDLKAQIAEGLDYDGPLGWLIRDIARSDHGKDDDQVRAEGDEDGDIEELEIEGAGEGGPPAWVLEKKASKKGNKGNRGRP